MKITLSSTDCIATIDGAPCRIWSGVTEDGVACVAFVRRVAVRSDARNDRFERELTEVTGPKLSDTDAYAAAAALLG